MRIKDIHLSEATVLDLGLKEIEMTRLDKVILIAGKNGVGKTRLLEAIRRASDWRREHHALDINVVDAEIEGITTMLAGERDYAKQYDLTGKLKRKKLERDMATALHVSAPREHDIPLIHFVPKQLAIAPLKDQTLGMLVERANKLGVVGVDVLCEGTYSYIYTKQRIWFESTHQANALRGDHDYLQEVRNNYARLQNLILELLGTKLQRNKSGEPELFGRSLDLLKLSDGQKILLQLAVALHAQGERLKDVILLLDEPENHLHSSALIDIIDLLRERITTGQLWICTHSVPLIAHVAAIDPYAIWYMEDGGVKRAGRKPEVILEALLGKPETIGNLKSFMTLPHELALANFAAQCMAPPQVVQTGSNDPQLLAIAQSIRNVAPTGRSVKVLDYGAGKGRLLNGLQGQYGSAPCDIADSIDYVAFDVEAEHKVLCEGVIASIYGRSGDRYFNDLATLAASRADFDVVVLTNVLHEIRPDQWAGLFSVQGIPSILSPTGWLLIVEDQRLPVGEAAHEFGFILLDTDQLKTLFGVGAADEQKHLFQWTDQRGDGRIKAHLIHGSLLVRFNAERQRAAIAQLRDSTLVEIRRLRAIERPTYADGQLMGLWTQLFANASLFLQT